MHPRSGLDNTCSCQESKPGLADRRLPSVLTQLQGISSPALEFGPPNYSLYDVHIAECSVSKRTQTYFILFHGTLSLSVKLCQECASRLPACANNIQKKRNDM
jgi:hypothetical protein